MSLANPASRNCVDKGGQLTIESNGKGGQFGVCTFADNRQCEEWAMMRGDCRTGGIKVTGFATPAARYCAITGGAYTVISASNTPDEQGKCAFKGGRSCDAAAVFGRNLHANRGACRGSTRTNGRAIGDDDEYDQREIPVRRRQEHRRDLHQRREEQRQAHAFGWARVALPQARSASGARYANANESVVFWNKGDTAFIDENGKSTYSGCSTQR